MDDNLESKIADVEKAVDGIRIIHEVERSMGGLVACKVELSPTNPLKGARITGVLHMTAQTAVLIDTLHALGADLRWCSSNAFSTQDNVAAAIVSARKASVFAWKGESLEEYWWCIKRACTWPDGKGPNIILDTGGDLTHLIHVGVGYEIQSQQNGAVTDSLEADQRGAKEEKLKVMQRIVREEFLRNPVHWREMAESIIGVCEQTSSGIHRARPKEYDKSLLLPIMNINDCITKSKVENVYGIKQSVLNSLFCALDIMLAGKTVLICGFGDVGKGCALAMRSNGARCIVSETNPVRALIAGMEGFNVTTIDSVVSEVDIFITATGENRVIRLEHMMKMKKHAIIGNMGHFEHEIDIGSLQAYEGIKAIELRPNVHRWVFPNGHCITLLAEGKLMNLICGTGNSSFVMSVAFTVQVLTQVYLWENRNSTQLSKTISVPPTSIDMKAALFHLPYINAELTKVEK